MRQSDNSFVSYVLGRRGGGDDIASRNRIKNRRDHQLQFFPSRNTEDRNGRRRNGRADEREQLLRSLAAPLEGQSNPTSANARKPSGVMASVCPSCVGGSCVPVPSMVCWWLCKVQIGWATVAECSNLEYIIPKRNARFYARRRSWLCGLRFAVPKHSCKRWP